MRATNRIAPHRKLHLLSVERGPGVCSIGNAGSHSRPPDERRLNHAIESLGTAWEGGRRQEVGSRRRAPRSSLPTPAASFDPSCGLPSAQRTLARRTTPHNVRSFAFKCASVDTLRCVVGYPCSYWIIHLAVFHTCSF
jgi:hypothetical protein